MKSTVLLCLLILIAYVSPARAQTAVMTKVGLVADGCLFVEKEGIQSGTVVYVVVFGEKQTVLKTAVAGACDDYVEEKLPLPPELKGRYRLAQGKAEGVGLVTSAPPGEDKTGVFADLNADGQREHFRECASSEGLHRTVWTGKPLEGERLWHGYRYLGYDVEENCDKRDLY